MGGTVNGMKGGAWGGDGRGRALGIRCFPQALSGCSKETNRLGERLFRASTLGSDRPSLSVFLFFQIGQVHDRIPISDSGA